eukprot:TRINITY_DN1219_c0_g1_i1.p1 TRINITY_DN1219_c0_g1~~TRINITY_DN1219_c0_g1_i1.p1  ORF type:complete len:409 (+),score=131.63 TRINITY_DN1219_c0_g1_i1:79-1227(+)
MLLNDFISGLKILQASKNGKKASSASTASSSSSSSSVGPLPRDQRVTRQSIVSIAKAIHKEITTFTLVLQSNISGDEFSALTKTLDGLVFTLLEHQNRIHAIPANDILRQRFDDLVNKLLNSIEQVATMSLKYMINRATKKQENQAEIASFTGIVWKYCKELESVPLNNREANLEEMKKWSATIKDAFKEIQEEEKRVAADIASRPEGETEENESTNSTSTKKDDDDDDDDDDDFEDFFDTKETYTRAEYEVLKQSFLLVKSAHSISMLAEKLVEKYIVDDSSEAAMKILDLLRIHFRKLSGDIDEVGSSVYPPHSIPSIQAGALELVKECKEICSIIQGEEGSQVFAITTNNTSKIIDMINNQFADALKGLRITDSNPDQQ